MTDKKLSPRLAALRALEHSLQEHRKFCAQERGARDAARRAWWRVRGGFRRPLVRRLLWSVGITVGVFALCVSGFLLRLAAGPLSFDLATPLLTGAIEQTIGNRHKVEVGGTQIERDDGNTSVNIRDIVIRDADGGVVASAPKAEVSISGTNLLFGRLRVKRVSLVGAELSLRIEQDGQLTISTGADRRPLAVTPAIVKPASVLPDKVAQPVPAPAEVGPGSPPQPALPTGTEYLAAFLDWIDKAVGPNSAGEVLGEIGLKSGSLTVDDRRTGRKVTIDHINFSLDRKRAGAMTLTLGSDDAVRPWLLTASISESGYQTRTIQVNARKVSMRDILLALRLDEGQIQSDIPLSGTLRAEIGADYLLQFAEGRLTAESGMIGDPRDPDSLLNIDRAEFTFDWDSTRGTLVVPFQIQSGSNRITLLSQFESPREALKPWRMVMTGGSIVISSGAATEAPLVLNRIILRAYLDMTRRRIDLEHGEIAGSGVNIAMSGNLDLSSGEPRLAGGFVATPMSGNVAKRIWPVFIASKVRGWVMDNVKDGEISRVEIASNAPIDTLREAGPPIPDDGLSVDVVMNNATITPMEGLPPIREAEVITRIKGRNAQVSVNRGVIEMASGRKLTLSNGLFEVPDTHPKAPPANARFRIEGPMQAAAELLALDKIKDASNAPLDPATSRGNFVGQVTVGLPITKNPAPGATTYNVAVDVSNFAADKLVMGQKVEAKELKVAANNQGYQIKGDIRLNGTPASIEYRKLQNEAEADVRLNAVLDEAARARFGLDTGAALAGPVPVRVTGKVGGDKDARLSIDADLTQAKIENLLPGWLKPIGKTNRATFSMVSKPQSTRFEDIVIDGSGALVKGSAELDANGDVMNANFPVFALSDGDKASLKVDRGNDGALRVVMRGEVYDGRNFIKTVFSGRSAEQKPTKQFADLDIDIRLGAVAGHHGEALRSLDFRISRRNGNIRSFTMTSKLGRDTLLNGDLRSAARGRQVMYLETGDAGALFRFTDNYARMNGGQMWVAIDPPTLDQAPQEGIMNVRDFAIRGEAALDRVVGRQTANTRGVEFTRARMEFTRTPGKLSVRDGVVRGPSVGATIEGMIDFARNDVRMRGTFVPAYGLNNAMVNIPIVGLFLGNRDEGLLGITYEVSGAPNAPVLRVNPISAIAPGLLRKFFEFPNVNDPAPDPAQTSGATPTR